MQNSQCEKGDQEGEQNCRALIGKAEGKICEARKGTHHPMDQKTLGVMISRRILAWSREARGCVGNDEVRAGIVCLQVLNSLLHWHPLVRDENEAQKDQNLRGSQKFHNFL